MKLLKRMLIALLVACSVILVAPVVTPLFSDTYTVEAASVKLNKTSITLGVGSTYTLKVKGTSKKVTWSSSDKSIAKVNSKGKVTAVKKGTVTITAKVGNKKYKCKVKVNKTPKLTYKVTSAKQNGGCYTIEGKVYNKTNTDIESALIKFDLYDASKNKITTVTDSIMWIDAAGTWKFKITSYVGDKTVKSYKNSYLKGSYFNVSTKYTKYTKFNTSIKLKKTESTSYSTTYQISGKLQNNNGTKLTDVFATYAFYDKNGNVIATRFCGYYDGVKKGKKISFKETAYLDPSLKAVTCKVVEVHGYNI
jgi:hypothetical protein